MEQCGKAEDDKLSAEEYVAAMDKLAAGPMGRDPNHASNLMRAIEAKRAA